MDYINFKKNKDLKKFSKIALGESFTTKTEYISYASYADFLQLDVTHFGGFTTTIDTLNDLSLLNLDYYLANNLMLIGDLQLSPLREYSRVYKFHL